MRWFLVSALVGLGCGASWAGNPVPDFRLTDVNTNSIRFNQPVSPRDYLLQVSGYYFGHAG